ncbi:hypothetical protein AB0J38_03395 [Streptomyces sp. NPDC050095]|uniref:hypothetical protein n=1 Tax=unclassified Streptomyces TaxID=2593676 RepID=UPI0034339826
MTDAESRTVTETFAFTCGDCGKTWKHTFRITPLPAPLDATGQTTLEYVDEATGQAVRTPLSEAVCPKCTSRKVHVVSPDLADRAHAAEHQERPHREHRLHLPHLRRDARDE